MRGEQLTLGWLRCGFGSGSTIAAEFGVLIAEFTKSQLQIAAIGMLRPTNFTSPHPQRHAIAGARPPVFDLHEEFGVFLVEDFERRFRSQLFVVAVFPLDVVLDLIGIGLVVQRLLNEALAFVKLNSVASEHAPK